MTLSSCRTRVQNFTEVDYWKGRPRLLLFFVLAGILPLQLFAKKAPEPNPGQARREWVNRTPLDVLSLYTPQIHRELRDAIAVRKACSEDIKMIAGFGCKEKMRERKSWRLNIFEAPNADALKKGVLEIRVSPPSGITFRYLRDGARNWLKLEPDFRCDEIESDCVAEIAVLDQQGDWIELPEGPMKGRGWINFTKDLGAPPRVRPGVIPGRSYILNRSVRATRESTGANQFLNQGEEVFVKVRQGSKLILRRARPGDAKCVAPKEELGEEPPEYGVHISELYSGEGRLRISPAYADYCPGFDGSEEKKRDLKL